MADAKQNSSTWWSSLVWPRSQPAPPTNPDERLISINPNTHEIVAKEFVSQARWHHAQVGNLEKALNEKTEECDKIRGKCQALVEKLNGLKPSSPIFMVDDAEITSQWNQLQYCIENLARMYLNDSINPKRLSRGQAALLERVSPMYREFLRAEGQTHLLFQSLMWTDLTGKILLHPTIVWGERVSKAVDVLLLKVYGRSIEDSRAWYAQTGSVLQITRGADARTSRYLKDRLHSKIGQFIPRQTLFHKKRAKIIRRSIEQIVDKATALAVIFNRSRCVYRVLWASREAEFDPSMIECGESSDGKTPFDLVVSPALLKFGNGRGENYHERLILAESCVCRLNRATGGLESGRG